MIEMSSSRQPIQGSFLIKYIYILKNILKIYKYKYKYIYIYIYMKYLYEKIYVWVCVHVFVCARV